MIVTQGPQWWVREVWQGCKGPDVDRVRHLLGSLSYAPGEPYDDDLAARVRGLQLAAGLEATGWVDQPTASLLQDRHDKRGRGQ